MTTATLPYAEVARELAKWGFRFVSIRREVLKLSGSLKCEFGLVPVDLHIRDWEFVNYPVIRILERPKQLEGVQPHVFSSGGLCYFNPGTVVLDRFDPVGAVLHCLEQARLVLNCLALDADYRREEFTLEYLTQWNVGQEPAPSALIKAGIDDGATDAATAILGNAWLIVGSEGRELQAIADAMGEPLRELGDYKAWILRTKRWPPLLPNLPGDGKAVFDWLRAWDPKIYQALQRRMEQDRKYLAWTTLRVLIEGPHGWLGFDLDLGDKQMRTRGARDRRAFVQKLHRAGAYRPLTRLRVIDWSARFIHSRNLSFPDLTDKKLTLVGCGAIGSHLAEALVRLGAGQGPQGRLRLIDPDAMEGGNLGRHALGYPSLTQKKATAMAAELMRTFPLAQVEGLVANALHVPNLLNDDLLIDATGEEALSEAINARQQAAQEEVSPVLYVRIFGAGEAVQTLWVDPRDKGACFRCLRSSDPQNYRAERFPLSSDNSSRQVRRGCHAITLYAVSAPMHAAALAADAVADWLSGNVSPRFRTLGRPGADVHKIKNQNPARSPNCPACARHSPAEQIA
jgi:molybdopterin/thiamine biosynthesis adenylyltransferase